MFKVFIFLSAVLFTSIVFADALFPLASGRPQQDGNCWAYGASHMLEAKAQQRGGVSVMTNIEKSYRYWLVHDRLLNSYHRKAVDTGDGESDINEVGGYAADLFYIYEVHGFEWLRVTTEGSTPDFEYPTHRGYHNRFQSNTNSDGLVNPEVVLQAEQRLVKENLTEAEALALIQKTLKEAFYLEDPLQDKTQGFNSEIPLSQTFQFLTETSMNSAKSMILLSSVLSKLPDREWFRYNNDRFQAISYHDPKEILKVVRASLDRGWPTTFETIDHVMTALGYKTLGDSYVYAISDSSGAYVKQGVTWVTEAQALGFFTDATVNFDVVADLLPSAPVMEGVMPSVRLPRKR